MSTRNDITRIRKLLFIIVTALVLYLLSVLKMIFIPLVFALFGALVFMPLIRWFQRKNISGVIGLITVFLIITIFSILLFKVISISGQELANNNTDFYEKFDKKLNAFIEPIIQLTDIEPKNDETNIEAILHSTRVSSELYGGVGSTLEFTRRSLVMLLMTLFFMILLLAGSVNIQKVMDLLIFKQKFTSVKTFRQIEKDIQKFIIVKFLMSLFTGIGFGIACYAFGVSFPFFWGLFTFAINFVQMVGSVIAVIVVGTFGLVEIDQPGIILAFYLVLTAIQTIFGGILEPIFMGKSFSINTVTILIMLALWGFIWGIPGLILSIPITALVKKIMVQFPGTKVYAKIMSREK